MCLGYLPKKDEYESKKNSKEGTVLFISSMVFLDYFLYL